MKTEHFEHVGVKEDGTFQDHEGQVTVTGGERHGLERGKWFYTVLHPRTPEGVVSGVAHYFDTEGEMKAFMKSEKAK